MAKPNLDKDAAFGFFDSHVDVKRMSPESLWPYCKGKPSKIKQRVSWPETRMSKAVLIDLFTLSKGKQIKHKDFFDLFKDWLSDKGLHWNETDTEMACYRIRAMMRHLRDFKLRQFREPSRKPPKGYDIMESVLRIIDRNQDLEEIEDQENSNQDLEEIELQDSEDSSSSEVELVAIVTDLTASSSMARPPSMAQLEELEQALFACSSTGTVPRKRFCAKMPEHAKAPLVGHPPLLAGTIHPGTWGVRF